MQFSNCKLWIALILLLTASSVIQAQTVVNITSIDANNFPFIYMVAEVNENGSPIATLTTADFTAFEDGRIQTDFFKVTPPDHSGGVRLVDFVFLIDNSGSMGDDIAAVRNNVDDFAAQLVADGFDIRLGAVRFGQYANSGNPIVMNNCNLTGDLTVFGTLIDSMTIDGGYEPGLQAVIDAASCMNFRPGAQIHFLIITDENSNDNIHWPYDGPTDLSDAITVCNVNNITVHGAVDCNAPYGAYSDYCSPTSITGATGGLVFDVGEHFTSDLITELGGHIANTYLVRYRTDNPVFDGVEREVILEANTSAGVGTDTTYYTPGAGPIITRTQPTIDLSFNAPINMQALTIEVAVRDDVLPGVTSVRLFYKHIGTPSYSSVNMTNTTGIIYSAQIPAGIVNEPGVQYYITATDGFLSSSSPTVDPSVYPYYIAILPNVAPLISHVPVSEAPLGLDITIESQVVDVTNSVASVSCFYRKTGTFIYSELPMGNVGGDNYSIDIPGVAMTEDGIDYYIHAIDDLGIVSIHGVHAILAPQLPDFTWIHPPLQFRSNVWYIWDKVRPLPIRFSVANRGQVNPDAIAKIFLQKYENGNPVGALIEGVSADTSDTTNICLFDPILEQYLFTQKTSDMSLGAWVIRIALDDGTISEVNVEIVTTPITPNISMEE